MPAEVAKSAISIAQKLARGSILLLSGLGKKPNPLSLYLSLSLSLPTPQTIKKKRERKKHTPPLSRTKPRVMNFPQHSWH